MHGHSSDSDKEMILPLLLIVAATGQLVTEIYQTCDYEEGLIARCGPGANCFIMDNVPTCHCVVDTATGLPLAGNPYRACTWDISGVWQVFSYQTPAGMFKEILNPISNEPIIFELQRTDAILKTKYMTGAIFVVTAVTSASAMVCSRAFLDVNDNTSIILEQAGGFVDQYGRSILLRTEAMDTTLVKRWPKKPKHFDKHKIKGKWQKMDGSMVKISKLKKPKSWPSKLHKSYVYNKQDAYWYNDAGLGAPLLRLSMAAFMDETLPMEKLAFDTTARYLQVGWYGALRFGSQRIDIISPADGTEIFTLMKIDDLPAFDAPGLESELANAFDPIITDLVATAGMTLDDLVPGSLQNVDPIIPTRRLTVEDYEDENVPASHPRSLLSFSKFIAPYMTGSYNPPSTTQSTDYQPSTGIRKLPEYLEDYNDPESTFSLLWEEPLRRLEQAEAESDFEFSNF